jgi:hypothetical protein
VARVVAAQAAATDSADVPASEPTEEAAAAS